MTSKSKLPLAIFQMFTGLALLVSLSACSGPLRTLNPFNKPDNPAAAEAAEAGAAADSGTRQTAPAERSIIEVLWRVPSDGVDTYLLDYGFEENNLDRQIRIPVGELNKIDHPKHGPVFRFELKGIPADRAIYLSLRAENKHGVSDPSRVVKVEPGQQSVVP